MNDEYKEERKRMVDLLRRQGVSTGVLEAMNRVKRHLFVPPELRDQAYGDYPLPIGGGQTISAPHMVAMMCEYLKLEKGDKVLEIGAGSGYHAAVIAELIGTEGRVYTVERLPLLVDFSTRNLRDAGYKNVVVVSGDGTLGLPEHAPFDKICVTCAAPSVPPPLLEQLKIGGKMVIPIGRYIQELYLVEKKNGIEKQSKCEVAFVPLIGRFGFR
ncbi:protein-L-isoaspartate O-methyltransferase [Methanosarcinales archaeon]|nr:protein-L-isoaspartate O-methyltransferase [Methanophagales archaeon]MCW3139286.1 protein-L-isoaspartate O-methyltransferase [Methanophagales archaeon]MCW7069333.1 protein-L-isoaspartate O-methyltransferase [Methanophagales archaeon]RLG35307.1 MAG: protein-L-isoaspartate O-methyltransferase [Methanosarcinales archaeon]